MQIQDIFRKYEPELKKVELSITRNFISDIELIPEISGYLVRSGGKRIRPLLLLICSDLCSYRGQRKYELAAVLEYIHTASLLHDDVVDSARTRRGLTSANRVWGNSASVLVGDFLYSKAFKMISQDGNLPVVQLISAVTNVMAEGEVFQLVKSGDIGMTEEDYYALIRKKTAILISAACSLGAVLANAGQAKMHALSEFGLKVGTAFQMTDDTLDYAGSEKEFGKAIGTDLREGKITLPLIRALETCTKPERERIGQILRKRSSGKADMAEVAEIIRRRNGIGYALDRARAMILEAKNLLNVFEDSEPKEALLTFSDFILTRQK
ncbi:MAG: polyprenyl synthetase family protein [Syntrophales bacterium]|nr:polyprenyl synthetase family protein [Syntrophales bacterium]MDD5232020.1 polyprenyl synthetase family protein [Syntrophales bacterium]MDD5532971.1 polyprenyl synthetase family protein [Syntrophales bacterium]